MKTIVIILALIIFGGCSAQWHLNKALKKDPEIINTEADTLTNLSIRYVDTTITINREIPVKIVSDTVYLDSIVIPDVKASFDTIKVVSSDSIARANISMHNGRLNVEIWAVLDTLIPYRDSLTLKNKIIYEQKEVIRKSKAEIRKKDTALDYIKWTLFGIIGLIVLIIIIRIIR
jgi:hypothetical protein